MISQIGRGLLILFGAAQGDRDDDCVRLAAKISKLRIFPDENGKTNLSLDDIGGEILSVSQFTLLADCTHGNRPSFANAADSKEAGRLYGLFNEELKKNGCYISEGIFGADMKVSLVNDGPFTIVLE